MKKLLALVLALVMVMGLSVVSTNAAYTDAEKIDHNEAVEVLGALKVLEGFPDGSFKPTGDVTRAQMAKMIAIIMLGADVQDSAFTGTKTDLNDINGHWAEGYIKFCVSQKIVAGYGDGTFLPDKNVTTAEAAKMLLTALGYNAEVQEYTGANWSVNVIRDAQYKKLFEDLSGMKANEPVNRDQAAQMIYNTVQRGMIIKNADQTRDNEGKITDSYTDTDRWVNAPITLLGETFDGMVRTGYLQGWTFDSNKKVWTYAFDAGTAGAGLFGGDAIGARSAISTSYTNGSANNYNTVNLDSKANYTDLYGQKVKVVYNIEKSDVVYGVFSDAKVLAEGAVGQISDIDAVNNTVKIDGTKYKYDAGYGVYNFLASVATATGNTLATLKDRTTAFTFKAIDNNDDDKIDAVVVSPVELNKIVFVGSDNFSASSGAAVASNKKEDNYLYDGLAAGDFAWYTLPANSPVTLDGVMTKAEVKTGKVDAIRANQAGVGDDEYQIDGTWYERGNLGTSGLNINNAAALELGDTVEYVTLGTKLYYAKVTDAAATGKDVVLFITGDQEGATSTISTSFKAKLLFSDGSKKTVGVATVGGTKTSALGAATFKGYAGNLYTYRINSDGEYELTAVGAGNLAGYKAYAGTLSYANKKVGTYDLADDAIVFVYDGVIGTSATTNGGKIYTGKEIKSSYPTTISTATGGAAEVLTKTVNGFTYAQLAAIPTVGGLTALKGNNYAYLTANAYKTQEGDDFYVNYKMWDGTAEVTVKAKADSSGNADADVNIMKKGAVVSYDTTSTEGVIKSVNRLNVETGVVTGWDEVGKEKIAIAPKVGTPISAKVTNDTTVLYVDSDKVVGQSSGVIRLANDIDGDDDLTNADTANVRYLYTAGAENIELLIVDINNEMKNGAATTFAATELTDATAFQTALNSGDVTITNDVAGTEAVFTAGFTVPEGTTLTIDDGGSNTTTVALANAKIVVKGKLVIDGTLNASAVTTAANAMDIDGGYLETAGVVTLTTGQGLKNTSDGTIKVADFSAPADLVLAKVANIIVTGNTNGLNNACEADAAVKTLTFQNNYTIGTGALTVSGNTTVSAASGKTLTLAGGLTVAASKTLTVGGGTVDCSAAIPTITGTGIKVNSGATLKVKDIADKTNFDKYTNNGGTIYVDDSVSTNDMSGDITVAGGTWQFKILVINTNALTVAANTTVEVTNTLTFTTANKLLSTDATSKLVIPASQNQASGETHFTGVTGTNSAEGSWKGSGTAGAWVTA